MRDDRLLQALFAGLSSAVDALAIIEQGKTLPVNDAIQARRLALVCREVQERLEDIIQLANERAALMTPSTLH